MPSPPAGDTAIMQAPRLIALKPTVLFEIGGCLLHGGGSPQGRVPGIGSLAALLSAAKEESKFSLAACLRGTSLCSGQQCGHSIVEPARCRQPLAAWALR